MGWAIILLITVLVAFGMSTLLITGIGIVGGLANKNIVQRFIEWVNDPGPSYVQDDRCCR